MNWELAQRVGAALVGIEVLRMAILMFVIISVATDTRAVGETAALAISATVALDALWGGPALVAGVDVDQGVYVSDCALHRGGYRRAALSGFT